MIDPEITVRACTAPGQASFPIEAELSIGGVNVMLTLSTDGARALAAALTDKAKAADEAWEEYDDRRQRRLSLVGTRL